MAERFNETFNIRQVSSNVGGVEASLSLANRLDSFRQKRLQEAEQAAIQRGVESAGQTELKKTDINGQQVTQAPQKKEKSFIGSIEVAAHNKALQEAYMASLDSDNRNAVAAISVEYNDDITGFNDAIEGYRAGVLKTVDPAARQITQIQLDDKIGSLRSRIQQNTLLKEREENDETLRFAAQRAADDALNLANEGNTLEAAESLLVAFHHIDARVESGLLNKAAGAEQKRALEVEATVENIRYTLKDSIERKGVLGAVDLINAAEDKKLSGFTVKEKDDLIGIMRADLSQHLTLENLQEKQQDDNLKIRQSAAFDDLYAGVLSGDVSSPDVQSAFRQKSISSGQAEKLISIFRTRGQGVDDWSLIREIQEDTIKNPELTRQTILNNTGSRLTEQTANELYAKTFEIEKTDSLLTHPDSKRFKVFLKNSVKVIGEMGAVDFDSQKRLAQLEVVYDQRILEGEDPAVVARDLVDVNSFLTAPNPLYGTKDDLDSSMQQLNDAFDAGAISDEEYNREYNRVTDLMRDKQNIESFNKALNEALKR